LNAELGTGLQKLRHRWTIAAVRKRIHGGAADPARCRADPAVSEVAARGLLHCGDIPVTVSGRVGAAAPEHYEWILWGTRRSYLLRNWATLSVSDGGDWSEVPLSGERARGESTRLTLFANAIRGHRQDDLADFAAGLRVQEAVEAFRRS
jgi:hypothetical protein